MILKKDEIQIINKFDSPRVLLIGDNYKQSTVLLYHKKSGILVFSCTLNILVIMWIQ